MRDARLLNGGWIGWEKGKHPTDKAAPKIMASEFKAVAAPRRMATKEELLKSLPGANLQIVDARSEDEFCGIDSLKNKRAGAMPGAKQLEWIDLIEKDTHRFKSPGELKKLFDAAGIKLDRPTATHCQSGGRASVMAYGLELMGAKDVRNYYKSWSEWGNTDETPIVKPEKKK
ncbi:MAG: rhodanese-like domain-containing protein [Gemmataceae bacterium]